MDLIYAIPDQTMAAWENDLRRALDCGIVHVSTYALTSEEGTALARRGAKPVDDALSTDMWELAETVAAQYGLARYEVSNLARPGHACRHNLDIWHGATYLGCGPAAASFDGELRWTNPPDLKRWLDSAAPREEDALPAPARAAELLAFGLRTVSGWERASFGDCTGFDYLELRGDILRSLAAEGLLVLTPERVCPTRLGLLFADHVARELL